MSVGALLLGDSRFPAGGHAHSGGVEPAVMAGTVADLSTLEVFLRGRLRTAGLVAAGIAATACARAVCQSQTPKYPEFPDMVVGAEIPDNGGEHSGRQAQEGTARHRPAQAVRDDFWALLDAEVDARTPSPAQREASRRQGRALLRAARVAWPDAAGLAALAASVRHGSANASGGLRAASGGPHHAVALGAAAAAAGCAPGEAARIAAYQAVAGPVSAAVRLLALDPMKATRVLARLTGEIEQVAGFGAAHAGGPLSDLPCASAPALDLLAETHRGAEVRLFES